VPNLGLFLWGKQEDSMIEDTCPLVNTIGLISVIPLVHPHMLRHACGYALADQGADTRLIQDYLGHRSIQHIVRYTATNPARFEKLWR